MSTYNNDIFPREGNEEDTTTIRKILEPYSCTRYITYPVISSSSVSRLSFRRRTSRGYVRFKYEYKNIMAWEYRLIEKFYRERKGKYDDFYVVDWSHRYHITGTPAAGVYPLDNSDFLTATAGYLGNYVIIYNTSLWGSETRLHRLMQVTNVSGTNVTLAALSTFDEDGQDYTHLDVTSSYIYCVYPCIFEQDGLQPNHIDTCVDTNSELVAGFGTQYLFGNIYDINLSFISLGNFAT